MKENILRFSCLNLGQVTSLRDLMFSIALEPDKGEKILRSSSSNSGDLRRLRGLKLRI